MAFLKSVADWPNSFKVTRVPFHPAAPSSYPVIPIIRPATIVRSSKFHHCHSGLAATHGNKDPSYTAFRFSHRPSRCKTRRCLPNRGPSRARIHHRPADTTSRRFGVLNGAGWMKSPVVRSPCEITNAVTRANIAASSDGTKIDMLSGHCVDSILSAHKFSSLHHPVIGRKDTPDANLSTEE